MRQHQKHHPFSAKKALRLNPTLISTQKSRKHPRQNRKRHSKLKDWLFTLALGVLALTLTLISLFL